MGQEIESIHHSVDGILKAIVPSGRSATKRKMKKSTTQLKRIAGIGVLILVCGVLTTGALMSFLVTQTSDITVGSMILWDGVPAENLETTESFAALGGETHEYNHTLSYNAASTNGDVTITFTWDGIVDGVTPSILINDVARTNYTLSPGDSVDAVTQYVFHSYVTAGAYNLTLTLELDGI